jgi:hypothetical protein
VKENPTLFGLFRGSWAIVGPAWDQDRYKKAIRAVVLGGVGGNLKCLGGVLRGLGRCLKSYEGDVQGI